MSASEDVRLVGVPQFGPRPTNGDFELTPQPSPGRAVLDFDFPGVRVGTAEYAEGPTGATVVRVPRESRLAIDDRGGAIGIIGKHEVSTEAICLAGGSSYGLAAATGVADGLFAERQHRTAWADLACVSGAIIYDFSARSTAVAPDAALGRAALHRAEPGRFPLGRCGAGRAASVGKVDWSRTEFAGQGAAFADVGGVKVLAATVVNAVGVVVDRTGTVVRGNYDAATGQRRAPAEDYRAALAGPGAPALTMAGNTTVSVVVTNVRLTDRQLNQFARQVHSSMHRGIQPFHTELDGDTLFAVSTGELELPVDRVGVNAVAVGSLASETMWDAILEAVR